MTYTPPPHLSIVRTGRLAGDRDVAFWVDAVRKQLQEHVAPAWGMPPPGVFLYDIDQFTPASEGAVIAIVDDDGNDDAAGLHSALGNVPFGLVDLHQAAVPSRTFSHEALELWANAMLDRWIPGPSGLEYAVELCDAVQREQYTIDVELFGEERAVIVSDFVLPAWFQQPDQLLACSYLDPNRHPADRLRPHANAPGGYSIARNPDGEVVYLAHRAGAFMEPRKLSRYSRTARLIRGQEEP
jgi:hypothetical protein